MDENTEMNTNGDAGEPTEVQEVRLSAGEYQSLLAAQQEADRLRSAEANASKSVEERIAAIETRYRSAAAAGALSDTLGGLSFTSDQAREDARRLLQADVEIRDNADGTAAVIYKPTGRPLGEVDRGAIEARFAHLLAPKSWGGSGAVNTRPGLGHSGPPSLGEQLVAEQLRRQGGPKGHPMFGRG